MKKYIALILAITLLAGCSTKEAAQVTPVEDQAYEMVENNVPEPAPQNAEEDVEPAPEPAMQQEQVNEETKVELANNNEEPASAISNNNKGENSMKSKVYFTKEITPESLVKIYETLGWNGAGKVGVKISTGEPPRSNYLRAELIGDLVKKVDGTIIE